MLVLKRKQNEAVIIGSDVKVTFLGWSGDSIRLGIEAPPDVPVHRQEVYESIKRYGEQRKGGEQQ